MKVLIWQNIFPSYKAFPTIAWSLELMKIIESANEVLKF